MKKFAFITAVAAAFGIASMVAVLWTSMNNREEAAVPGHVLATRIAEWRSSDVSSIDGDRSAPESALPLTPTATPAKR